MHYSKILKILICLIGTTAACIHTAWAGPPFVTDDPEPVKYQHWEINSGVSKTWREGSVSAGLPSIDINYGAAPNMQLHAQPRYSYERTTAGGHFGIDDTEVGVKYRFLNIGHGDSSIMAGIYPMLQLPTGDVKLGPNRGKGQTFLPLWVQRNSEKWIIYGGAGYRINPGTGNKNSVFTGVTALYQVKPSLQLGGEVFHETATAVDETSTSGFNLGGSYNLARDYNLLFSAGKGLKNASSSNQLSVYLALQFLY